jgi:hypothetical protein
MRVAHDAYRKVVYWRVRPDGRPNDLLMLALDAADGSLLGITCPRLTPQVNTFAKPAFELLANAFQRLPQFDLAPWSTPDVKPSLIPSIEVSADLSLRVGATAFSIQIGEEQRVENAFALAKVHLGFGQDGELVRIDVVELASDRIAAITSWLKNLDNVDPN